MIRTFKYSTLSCAILAIIMINSCGIFPESCPDDVILEDLRLEENSLYMYPHDLPPTLTFRDENNLEKTFNIVESTGKHKLVNEQLCSTETDLQFSYSFGEYKRTQYTAERERFFIELGVWNDFYRGNKDINDVLRIYRLGEEREDYHLKLVFDNRENSAQREIYFEHHKNISLNGKSFTNVYQSNSRGGYMYYYAEDLGVVAIEENDHIWVISN